MENSPAEQESELTQIVQRNIHALVQERRKADARMGRQERAASRITAFTGSMRFVYLHLVLYGGWILINTGVVPGVRPFDPFPFVMLAMAASVEAIFLSTFVLISQNRMMELADRRADLDLQISLLSEHEITRLIRMVDGIAERMGVTAGRGAQLEELKRDVAPEKVLEAMEEAKNEQP
jgi:uncharacterized membrane protein